MAYWVHVQVGDVPWRDAAEYDPPAPRRVSRKGYPILCVAYQDTVLRFSSRPQAEEFIRVLRLKPLPTSSRLSAARCGGHGPNSHWLSRLPPSIKSPKHRIRVVQAVVAALKDDDA